jgi:hypothetical protein
MDYLSEVELKGVGFMRKMVFMMAVPVLIFSGDSLDSNINGDSTEALAIAAEEMPELSIVHSDGSVIETRDGKTYEIQESDWNRSGGWILPGSLTIKDLNDGSEYPLEITNNTTKTSVKGRLVEPKNPDNQEELEKPSEK